MLLPSVPKEGRKKRGEESLQRVCRGLRTSPSAAQGRKEGGPPVHEAVPVKCEGGQDDAYAHRSVSERCLRVTDSPPWVAAASRPPRRRRRTSCPTSAPLPTPERRQQRWDERKSRFRASRMSATDRLRSPKGSSGS